MGILEDYWKRVAVEYDPENPEEYEQALARQRYMENVPMGGMPEGSETMTTKDVGNDWASMPMKPEPNVHEYTQEILQFSDWFQEKKGREPNQEEVAKFLDMKQKNWQPEDINNRTEDLANISDRIEQGGDMRFPKQPEQDNPGDNWPGREEEGV